MHDQEEILQAKKEVNARFKDIARDRGFYDKALFDGDLSDSESSKSSYDEEDQSGEMGLNARPSNILPMKGSNGQIPQTKAGSSTLVSSIGLRYPHSIQNDSDSRITFD